MIRLTLVFIGSLGISFSVLYCTGGVVAPVYTELLSAFIAITLLFGAASWAFFSYLDGIAKDLPAEKAKSAPEAYEVAIASLGNLRKEVISNIYLVISLLVIERVLYGIVTVAESGQWEAPDWVCWLGLSVRLACLLTCFVAVGIQLRGFVTANELRDQIGRFRGK